MNHCSHCKLPCFPPGMAFGYAGPVCTCFNPATYGPLPTTSPGPTQADWAKMLEDLKKNPPKIQFEPKIAPQGWQCPICETVHAPFVRACGCAGRKAQK